MISWRRISISQLLVPPLQAQVPSLSSLPMTTIITIIPLKNARKIAAPAIVFPPLLEPTPDIPSDLGFFFVSTFIFMSKFCTQLLPCSSNGERADNHLISTS
uniref:Uncharacterized protein n=1 Tax=Opuntia streptacantha TaxID=393608 RepID=A0A7C9E502_OPUST